MIVSFRLLFLTLPLALSSSAAPVQLDGQLENTVRPFLNKYCVGCHSGKTPAAQFDLKAYPDLASVTREFPRWELVRSRLIAQDMPPKPMKAPPAEEARKVIDWIQNVRTAEIKRSAGDPGVVYARRLSNAEYNYTIRDLTGGHNLDVTREFPIDPANPAGFDNSGESLTMSPALLNKYLQAAREVANHMVLTPDSIDFAGHPMLVETDREKYAIQRILDFYFRQPTKYADYFRVAARTKNAKTLSAAAAEAKLSPKYLRIVWDLLQEPNAVGPIAKLQTLCAAGQYDEAEAFVKRIRLHTSMQYAAPKVFGLPAGSQPLLNWKLWQFARHRRESDPAALRNDTDPAPEPVKIPKYPGLHAEAAPRWAALMANWRAKDTDLVVPAAQRKQYEAAFARFANVFPDHFFVSERGRYFPDDSEDKGRFLSAGYHNTNGFFRDDIPLQELILDEKGKAELDRLWLEFDYIAKFTERTWVQYYFNQSGEVLGKGAESGHPRPVGHEVTDSEVIAEMRDKYLAKAAAQPGNDPAAPEAIRDHFTRVNATLRGLEKVRKDSEAKHLQALLQFAARAYRRPLTRAEGDDLLAFYTKVRTAAKDVSHEAAVRECVVSVLMSPDFLYRVDLPLAPAKTSSSSKKVAPLAPYALASRLSYFLWASMPDPELLRHAAAGDLQRPDVMLAQTRRMLQDPRVSGLATEFTGNLLQFRHFDRNNSVDRERFPSFTNDLRAAMFEEPVRLIQDAMAGNRPVLDLLYGKYTFVNPVLAKHYGIPDVTGDAQKWVRVDDATPYGRGGLLPMAVFLTQNSPGLRTSPVKRGNWVVQRVLGEAVPPPPPVVPELPHDEAVSELPVRALLAKHREVAMCAACHRKIDPFGLPFEAYGPVGNARTKDLAGRPVDTVAEYPDGSTRKGLDGLQSYIREKRQKDFVANVSRKLLAYALGRSLQLSDEALVEQMEARAAADGYRFRALFETIVTSPQFLNRRVVNE